MSSTFMNRSGGWRTRVERRDGAIDIVLGADDCGTFACGGVLEHGGGNKSSESSLVLSGLVEHERLRTWSMCRRTTRPSSNST